MYKKCIIILTALAIILLNLSCTVASSTDENKDIKLAPDFTLNSLSGEEITLSQFRDKKNVLLVFGATWCPYCVNEIPELKDIYERYNDEDVKLLYIDVQESSQKVSSFAKRHSIPYTILLDTVGDVVKAYGVRGIPHQVIIDKKGVIYYSGPRPYTGLLPLLLKLQEG